MTWSIPESGNTTLTLTFQVALDAEGNLTFTEQDSSGNRGAGIIRRQTSTSFTAGVFSGDYTFVFPGYDATNKRSVMAGRFRADGSSLITNGSADVNDAGTHHQLRGHHRFVRKHLGKRARLVHDLRRPE